MGLFGKLNRKPKKQEPVVVETVMQILWQRQKK